MILRNNTVYQVEGARQRVVSILAARLVLFNIDDPEKSLPYLYCKDTFVDLLNEEIITQVDDPFDHLALKPVEPGSKAEVKRDERFQVIRALVQHDRFYDPLVRGKLVAEAKEEFGRGEKFIYKWFRRYFERGWVKNALLGDYEATGVAERRYKVKTGRPSGGIRHSEAIIQDEVEEVVKSVIKAHYLDNSKTLPQVYDHVRTILFDPPHCLPGSRIPSEAQFRNYIRKHYSDTNSQLSRLPKKVQNNDAQPITSTAIANVNGPGSRYEFDATIVDIYLTSDYDPSRVLGRPTLYLVVCTYSRMIAGYYIGFEAPSYHAAMQALISAMSDSKIKRAHDLGLDWVTASIWPTIGLCEAIAADRGELMADQTEYLQKQHGMSLETPGPYKAVFRSIGERRFGIVQGGFKGQVDGVVIGSNVKKRGDPDYVDNANMSLDAFERILIALIVHHNQFENLKRTDLPATYPDEVPLKPLNIWQWGQENCTGYMQQIDEVALKVALLPKKEATLSNYGLNIYGLFYRCRAFEELGWFHRKGIGASKRPNKLKVAYDPRCMDRIYIVISEHNDKPLVAELSGQSESWRGQSLHEIKLRKSVRSKTDEDTKDAEDESLSNLQRLFDETNKTQRNAKKSSNPIGMSKTERKRGIEDNRDEALRAERAKNPLITPLDEQGGTHTEPYALSESTDDFEDPDILEQLQQRSCYE